MSKRHEADKTARPLSEAELRRMLLATQQELVTRIREGRGGLREGAVQLAQTSLGDLADRPVLTPEAEMGYEVVDRRAHILAQIELALKKLEDGSYGRCETCEEPIPAARLRALPFAIRCTRCQEAWELRVRRTGGAPVAADLQTVE
ncbi:MAG: TraR/DksA family transcriptional regulator [Candidatus Rokubacteria bacterium]|nr:TraR/DksA family transcriptional regulator [Candidatus Rokubacteria bacterium]